MQEQCLIARRPEPGQLDPVVIPRLYLGHCPGPSLPLSCSPWLANKGRGLGGYSKSAFQPQRSTAMSHGLCGHEPLCELCCV